MQPQQIGDDRLQDHPAQTVPELLVLLVQPVDDRLAVGRAPVELGELGLDPLQPGEHRVRFARLTGRLAGPVGGFVHVPSPPVSPAVTVSFGT